MRHICVLLSVFVVVFFVFSANIYTQSKVELNKPSIINLSYEELSYHHSMAMMLMYQCGTAELIEKVKMAEMHESYGRALYKIEAIIKAKEDTEKTPHELTYYIYAFLDRDIVTKRFRLQYLNVVCVWENNNAALLNSGFKKDCSVNNNWLYWEKGNSPDILDLERELRKAFNFEQIEKKQKKKRLDSNPKKKAFVPSFFL